MVRPPEGWSDSVRGTVRQEWVSLLDVYPTALDCAGAGSDRDAPGMSLLPLLHNQPIPWRDSVFVEFNGVNSLATSMVTVRKGNIKYDWNCSSRDELYDLNGDPWEMRNVAEDPSSADQLRTMRLLLDDWMRETRYPGRGMYRQTRIVS